MNNTVKKIFLLIKYFFLAFFVSLLIAAFTYLLYIDTTWLTAGSHMQFFSLPVLIDGVLFFIPVCAVFSLLGLFFVCIRHNCHSVSTALTVLAFCILVWFVALPQALRLQEKKFSSNFLQKDNPLYVDQLDRTILTPNYFRPLSSALVYYTKIDPEGQGTGVLILSDQDALFTNALGSFENMPILPDVQFGYRDPLIARTARLPSYVARGVTGYALLLSSVKQISVESFSKYGIAIAFCLGFFSLWGFSLISSWRLLNVFFVLFGMSCFLYLNYWVFAVRPPVFLSAITTNSVLVALVLNGALFILASLWGFISSYTRREKYPKGEDN